jgi:transposase
VVEVLHERCAGIDIGKADLKACTRTPGPRGRREEVRTFATTTAGVLALRDWLTGQGVTVAGMESTGSYWKPVYYLLEDALECQLLNPRHMRNLPGRKTDVSDAAWIAQLVEFGLVRPSFVPPPPIRALRDLTRYRTALTRERTREAQRLQNVLEDAGIKLGVVATDVLGVSGRDMIEALIAGERDPVALAELARKALRRKIPALREALTGRFGDHHAFLCRMMLDHIADIEARVAGLDAQIDTAIAPFHDLRDRLGTIPGVSRRIAEILIAETGADMTRFPTPAQLASWAGMCPGNNESAGKHHSGRTRHGDTWLRGALGEAAAAASRTRGTYLGAQYHRLAGRRGKKRALVAVGHSILIAAWHISANDTDYHDLGPSHFTTHVGDPTRRTHRLVQQLNALGYQVALNPVAA